MKSDEFYVGYLPIAPGYRRFTLGIILITLPGVAALATLLAALQRHPGDGRWHAEQPVTLEGVLEVAPYALLHIPGNPPRAVLLVEEGKFGAAERARPLAGQSVRVRGTLLERSGWNMVELLPGEEGITPVEGPVTQIPQAQSRGRVTLHGEIVDSKCYLGAMKPGEGKTHKGCAALCLAGGVPPLLATRDADGTERLLLVVDAGRGPAGAALAPYAGDRVSVTGELWESPGVSYLAVDSDGVRR